MAIIDTTIEIIRDTHDSLDRKERFEFTSRLRDLVSEFSRKDR